MSTRPGRGLRSVAYYVNWAIYGRKHFPWEVPASDLTHILYSFANVRETGEVFLTDGWADTDIRWTDRGDTWDDVGKTNLYGCMKQLNILKAQHRQLKVLLSVGGWTYSQTPAFPTLASSPEGRATFARSSVELLKDLGYDGVDIDWEYPKSEAEAQNFVLLLEAVRRELDAYAATLLPSRSHHFELTVACPAGAQNYEKLKVADMDRHLDFWNLMAYDYAGGWDSKTGHAANWFPSARDPDSTAFSTQAALDHYAASGVARDKLVVGMPLYGRGWDNTAGPGKPYQGQPQGDFEVGTYAYKNLPLPGAVVETDLDIVAGWSRTPAGTLVSHDTVEVARRKAELIREQGLGGGMWWETSGDKHGAESLIQNVVQVFGGKAALDLTENCVDYPQSKYDNVKKGFST